jgi:lipopolysaccharide export system protein LptC
MQINLQKKIATSRVPIKIIQGLNTITAKGMVADLNKEQIRLMPDVESIYVPATP